MKYPFRVCLMSLIPLGFFYNCSEDGSNNNSTCSQNQTGMVCFVNTRPDSVAMCIGCNITEFWIAPGDTFCQEQGNTSIVTYYYGDGTSTLDPLGAYQVDVCEIYYEIL